jgi:hypothetical protein
VGARIDTHEDLWPTAIGGWAGQDEVDRASETVDAPETGADRHGLIAAVAAGVVVIGWVGGLCWLMRDALGSMRPIELVQFLTALCVAPVLVGIVWLLARRTSRAEAQRFGASAQTMRAEAAALERRVASLSRTLAAQREAIAAQLDAGAAAATRFEAIGQALHREVAQAETQADNLAATAERARATVGDLVAAMPQACADSEEVGRRLDQAGLTAAAQAAVLEAQLNALGERARASTDAATAAAERLAAHIERMDATSHRAGTRLEEATAAASVALDQLVEAAARRLERQLDHLGTAGTAVTGRMTEVGGQLADLIVALLERTEAAALSAHGRLADRGDEMLVAVAAHQAALEATARDGADALAIRLDEVDATIDRIATRLGKQRSVGQEMIGDLVDGAALVERQLDSLHANGSERTQMLAASISALGGSADAMTEALRAGDAMATRTIATTEALLVALDAAAREIDETLPDALGRLDGRVDSSRHLIAQARPDLLTLVSAAETTHDAVEAIAGTIADQRRTLDNLSGNLLDALSNGRDSAGALAEAVDQAIDRSNRLSEEATPRLIEALLRVRDTAQVAADRAREAITAVIPAAAAKMEQASAEAMRRAAGDTIERQVTAIGEATQGAVAAAARATEQLTGQIDAITQHGVALDARLDAARSSDTLARRVTLLIETLNSASIDIAKAFSPDIADSAWAAYLKGDRGVFTRRAVRLIDAGDAQRIAQIYDENRTFNEQVNRYIHDFEAMLRTILTQRDGSALGVTLLSSDMGKLYVALAHAIERLR